jgi:hypothetical protein
MHRKGSAARFSLVRLLANVGHIASIMLSITYRELNNSYLQLIGRQRHLTMTQLAYREPLTLDVERRILSMH